MRFSLTALCLLLLALALPHRAAGTPQAGQFQGKLLVATPHNPDARFERAVVYMVRHTPRSSVGVVVNKPYGKGPLAELMKQLGLDPGGAAGEMQLQYGGPVAVQKVFFLHTSDYVSRESEKADDSMTFSQDVGILTAVANGKGPRRLLVTAGYAGWSAGQLEGEILRGFWTVAEPDETLVFGGGKEDAWERLVERGETPL